jgi:uncharacterized protein (DUF2267 family)
MSFTGVKNLDHSIDKTNAWLAEIAAEFGTEDRQFAYRVTRTWLHALRDRLPVQVAANFAAQLPELLRGVFYGAGARAGSRSSSARASTCCGSPGTPGSTTPTCRGRPGW